MMSLFSSFGRQADKAIRSPMLAYCFMFLIETRLSPRLMVL